MTYRDEFCCNFLHSVLCNNQSGLPLRNVNTKTARKWDAELLMMRVRCPVSFTNNTDYIDFDVITVTHSHSHTQTEADVYA